MNQETYVSPFSERYASAEMQYLFSPDFKFKTWRRLWIALAKAERALGLPITEEQIAQMEQHRDDIDYETARAREKEVRHDVMAHIYAYAKQCPKAEPIIHLGATSCYVGDNTDVITMRRALLLVRGKLLRTIANLTEFALEYKALPCLAYTHLQPAQLTTVGKRAALWINELVYDFQELSFRIDNLELLGSKGTTGTQASFLELFEGDGEKVKELDDRIAREMGFSKTVAVSGQTYSRKVDFSVVSALCAVAQSAYKFAGDLRLLQAFKEMEEPFEPHQIGSSAMPYKRNPMRSERICALARFVIADLQNPAMTASAQWFERTLDDSANKRLAVAEAFLAVDSILNIFMNITQGLVVYPKVVASRVQSELPFMASENIMMRAVKKGGNRQELHERLRAHSIAAGKAVKEEGRPNDLIERICADQSFGLDEKEMRELLDPSLYIGRAPEQVEELIRQTVDPLLSKFHDQLDLTKTELRV